MKWTERFLKREAIVKLQIAVYSFDDGRFDVAYFERDGTWKVGWKGPYSVAADEVTMTDEFSGVTDVYRWRVTDRGLDLDRVSTDTDTVNGFPYRCTTPPTSATPGRRPTAPWNRVSPADSATVRPGTCPGRMRPGRNPRFAIVCPHTHPSPRLTQAST